MDTEKILITGAGFTHNFGAPLAKDMWGIIFNHKQIQKEQKIRNLMLGNYDYESIYDSIMSGDYTQSEKDAISNAIHNAYEKLDAIIREWRFVNGAPYPVNIYKVQKLIDLFSKVNKKGFFFTLNQDLFIERHYYNGRRLLIPGLQTRDVLFSTNITREPLERLDFCQLPTKEYIEENKSQILSSYNFLYVKLHGSQNWKSQIRNQQMVIGRGKRKKIQDEPLLEWYFEIFEKVLCRENLHILIIGYGFADEHINEIISQAIEQFGLKLNVISPLSIEEFCKTLSKKKYGKKILSGLSGYFPYKLIQMFPSDQSDTQAWKDLRELFFQLKVR